MVAVRRIVLLLRLLAALFQRFTEAFQHFQQTLHIDDRKPFGRKDPFFQLPQRFRSRVFRLPGTSVFRTFLTGFLPADLFRDYDM